MSKIICDVCGTAYPETSTQCPICGYVRPVRTSGTTGKSVNDSGERTYTYVKGGRFSKSNVKKRNRANQAAESPKAAPAAAPRHREPPKKKSNTGLIVTAIILLLAIVAVVIYLALKLFWPALPPKTDPTDTPLNPQPIASDHSVKCEDINLDVTVVRLSEIGEARMLDAEPIPANTTDDISYVSSDESVATVNANGKIVAVGPGEATVTVICGDVQKTCQVVCEIEVPTEDPTDESTEDPSISLEDFRLNREDITFSFQGEKWKLYSGDIDVSLITWTSDNESVAYIVNGVVEAVGVGTTTVHGEINGVKVSCIIRCSFTDSDYEGVGGHGGVGEDS